MAAIPDARRSIDPGGRLIAWLVALVLPVYFLGLGANSIWEANEAFYVDTPRHMVESGDYVTPMWNGEPRVNKPVLSYWMVAGLYQVLGVSVTTERVGIAIGALGIMLATFLIGRAWRSTTVGLLAAFIVASAPRVVMFSRRIFIDIWISAFMGLALACFVLALRHPPRRRTFLVLMYVAIGLGVLTKGPVAIVLPAAVFAAWATLERRWHDLRHLMLAPGAAIVLAIVAPWYVALYHVHGWGPVTGFFIGENVDRFTTSMVPGERNILFYLPVLFGDLFPWAPLLLIPIVSAWRKASPAEDAVDASIRRLLWLWIVVITCAFSLSQTKQDLYIFPTVPAVAVLVADVLVATGFGLRRAAVRRILAASAMLAVLGGVVGVWLFSSGYYQLPGVWPAAAILVAGGIVTLAVLGTGRAARAVAALAVAFVVFDYLFVLQVLPDLERLKPAVPLAQAITAHVPATAELGEYKGALPPSLVFYARRPVQRIGAIDHAAAFFGSSRGSWVLVEEGNYAELAARVPGLCEVARHPVFETKARNLISGEPPPNILLMTNRCPVATR